MLTINGLIGIMAQPHLMAAVSTGKDEHACRVGFFHGNYVKRLCTVGWAIVGLMVAVMVNEGVFGVHVLADPEDAFGFACQHFVVARFSRPAHCKCDGSGSGELLRIDGGQRSAFHAGFLPASSGTDKNRFSLPLDRAPKRARDRVHRHCICPVPSRKGALFLSS